jgi:hypothetical protein
MGLMKVLGVALSAASSALIAKVAVDDKSSSNRKVGAYLVGLGGLAAGIGGMITDEELEKEEEREEILARTRHQNEDHIE